MPRLFCLTPYYNIRVAQEHGYLAFSVVRHELWCASEWYLPHGPWGVITEVGRQHGDPQLTLNKQTNKQINTNKQTFNASVNVCLNIIGKIMQDFSRNIIASSGGDAKSLIYSLNLC